MRNISTNFIIYHRPLTSIRENRHIIPRYIRNDELWHRPFQYYGNRNERLTANSHEWLACSAVFACRRAALLFVSVPQERSRGRLFPLPFAMALGIGDRDLHSTSGVFCAVTHSVVVALLFLCHSAAAWIGHRLPFQPPSPWCRTHACKFIAEYERI